VSDALRDRAAEVVHRVHCGSACTHGPTPGDYEESDAVLALPELRDALAAQERVTAAVNDLRNAIEEWGLFDRDDVLVENLDEVIRTLTGEVGPAEPEDHDATVRREMLAPFTRTESLRDEAAEIVFRAFPDELFTHADWEKCQGIADQVLAKALAPQRRVEALRNQHAGIDYPSITSADLDEALKGEASPEPGPRWPERWRDSVQASVAVEP